MNIGGGGSEGDQCKLVLLSETDYSSDRSLVSVPMANADLNESGAFAQKKIFAYSMILVF